MRTTTTTTTTTTIQGINLQLSFVILRKNFVRCHTNFPQTVVQFAHHSSSPMSRIAVSQPAENELEEYDALCCDHLYVSVHCTAAHHIL